MTIPQSLNIVEVVTREHGETFAEWWGEVSRRSGALTGTAAVETFVRIANEVLTGAREE